MADFNKIIIDPNFKDSLAITLTAKGLYAYELENNIISHDILIDNLNTKYFTQPKQKDINDKDLVILSTMLFARTFNVNSCIDLNKGTLFQNIWAELINKTAMFLNEVEFLSKSKIKDLLPKRKTRKSPIVQLMQKADELPRKNGFYGLFIAHGNRKYSLNIFNSDNLIDQNKYFSLLSIIFPKEKIKDPKEIYNLVNVFQKKIILEYKSYIVNNLDEVHALASSFDFNIEEQLTKYFFGN